MAVVFSPRGERLMRAFIGMPGVQQGAAWVARQVIRGRLTLPDPDVEHHARFEPEELEGDPGIIADPLIHRFSSEGAPVEGPLAGMPVVVKDNLDIAGCPTGRGTLQPGPVASTDAALVRRLSAAGARIVGKAHMTEMGVDGLGVNPHLGTLANPRAPACFTGGSSSGTGHAIAAGIARMGIGSDALGSIRLPSAYCGIVGLKPTLGRMPVTGYHTPSPSLDQPGPMAIDATHCALLWQVLAGEPVEELPALRPARVATLAGFDESGSSRAVADGFERALGVLGAHRVVHQVEDAARCTILGALIGAFELTLDPRAHLAQPSPEVAATAGLGALLGRPEHVALQQVRYRIRARLLEILRDDGFIVMPTSPIPPPVMRRTLLRGGVDMMLLRAAGAFTPLANLTGLPAIAMPCGADRHGRPLSLMALGVPGSEHELLGLALGFERALAQ